MPSVVLNHHYPREITLRASDHFLLTFFSFPRLHILFSKQKPNMPAIRKTKAMATTAGAAFPFCFIDPTGTSQLVFLSASAGAGVGVMIHASQASWRGVQKLRSSRRQAKFNQSDEVPAKVVEEIIVFDQRAFEECIRKLASSMTGVVVSGTLSIMPPHYLVGFFLNGAEVAYQLHKLRRMRDLCGGTKQLMENVSKLDVALQVSAGLCIKVLTTILFLGAGDFNTFVDQIAHASDALMALTEPGVAPGTLSASDTAEAIKAAHDNILDHGLLLDSTAVAGAPTEALSQVLGNGPEYTPTWNDGASPGDWGAMGVVNTIADTSLSRVVEEPIHKVINGAATAGEKAAARKHEHEKRKRKRESHLSPSKKRFPIFRKPPSPSALSSHALSPQSSPQA